MNLLSHSVSPYLLQHKNNPVEWHEWSKESLDKAKSQDKPILVSIGYSTCHWCHVMAHESFEDKDIAAIMNEYFINIKVDREERPDLDHYIMNAVQAMGISGGWPLHCFLTPDLKPFYGGTYFPPIRKYGRISWPELLMRIHESWKSKRGELILQAEKLNGFLNRVDEGTGLVEDGRSRKEYLELLNQYMDHEQGGFGFSQKFPNTMALDFIMEHGDESHQEFIIHSLNQMSLKGMFDILGGGFFRYTIDRNWSIPHFEKMAYDHGLILATLSKASLQYSTTRYLPVIQKSFEFWENEMSNDKGLFYSGLDADSEGEEGKYYAWSKQDIENALSNEPRLKDQIHWVEIPHTIPASFHLNLKVEAWSELTGSTLTFMNYLLKIRSDRISPSKDTKCILGWNALICSAYCHAWKATYDPNYLKKAIELIHVLCTDYKRVDQRYFRFLIDHTGHGLAYLEDYVYLIQAIIDVHQITLDPVYLKKAREVIDLVNGDFLHSSGFYTISSEKHLNVIQHSLDFLDHSIPNPNATMFYNLYNWAIIGDDVAELKAIQQKITSICENSEKLLFSKISWFNLLLKLEQPYWKIKCRQVKTAYLYLSKVFKVNMVFELDDSLKETEIQICTNELCYPVFHNMVEFSNWYKSQNV
ncbi:MAG: thioredoxin domain-containing protein [Saprospiraceae bacterium]|nr:thioredoxin domain-containing protein [Saprospiraceae bacterium]